MASLNGISIRGLKSTEGSEGIVWSGELYLNNVKIGVWSNDYYDGPDWFKLLPGYDEGKLKAKIQKRYSEWEICPTEIFMGRLVDLTLEEQLFSRVNKNSGRILLSIGDGYHGVHIELPMDYMTLSDEEILEKEAALIKTASKKLLPETEEIKHEIKIRRKPEDFCEGDTIMLDAIRES